MKIIKFIMDYIRSNITNAKSETLKNVLRGSIYSHKVSEEEPIEQIELEEFNFDKIRETIKKSSSLLNYNTTHKPIIMEILKILENNKDEFIVDQYKFTGFYWNGIPILRIELKSNDNQKDYITNKELHISLHRYKKEKTYIEAEKRTHKVLMFGLGGSLLLGSLIAAFSFFRKND